MGPAQISALMEVHLISDLIEQAGTKCGLHENSADAEVGYRYSRDCAGGVKTVRILESKDRVQ